MVKAVGKLDAEGVIAVEATKRISSFFRMDNRWSDLSKKEHEEKRQQELKPKVDEFFAWTKEVLPKVPAETNTAKGLQYCINQERFLRVFLSNGNVPLSNNLAEQAIRPFTLGRKNWVTTYSVEGAKANAVLYSLVETAKANRLKVREYLEFTLQVLVNHAGEGNHDYLKDLLPWCDTVQKKFRIPEKS